MGMGGCEAEAQYEDISLEYTRCPCEHETNFIKQVSLNNVLLFEASKTSFTEMKEISSHGEESEFVEYFLEKDSAVFYSFKKISNIIYVGIGYICNFPQKAREWVIPHGGIEISFTADTFDSCKGVSSVGFTQTYSDNILISLKRKIK